MPVLGGMIGPRHEEAPVMAAEKSSSKPASFMALSSMAPIPPVSASALPDMPAKITLQNTLTWPRPPGISPTRVLQKSKMRVATPPAFMIVPASMKNGIASMLKESPTAMIRR